MSHGTNAGYTAGCRCDPCRNAHRIHVARWRRYGTDQASKALVPGVPDIEFGGWRDDAACKGRDDLVWFPNPPKGPRSIEYRTEVAAAVEVCAVCPVRAECLDAALATAPNYDHGIRGGMTAEQRRRLRRERRKEAV